MVSGATDGIDARYADTRLLGKPAGGAPLRSTPRGDAVAATQASALRSPAEAVYFPPAATLGIRTPLHKRRLCVGNRLRPAKAIVKE